MIRTLPDHEGVLSPSKYRTGSSDRMYGTSVSVPITNIIPCLMIEWYQSRTVDRPHRCVFRPTCSEYSRLAYIRYGPVVASLMTIERLKECGNWRSEWPSENKP